MLPEHFYMTDLGKIAYVALYLPLVMGLLWWLFRKYRTTWPLLTVFALILLTLPFWDVYFIGRDAERLCREQGGLHVYKVVEAEGFLGDSSIEIWSKYGFKYVESGDGNKMSRYTMRDGKAFHQRIQEFISSYQAKSVDNHKVVTRSISKSSGEVVDRESNEVLGDIVYFSIHPGLFDGVLLKLTGSGPVVWHCGNEPPQESDALRLGLSDVVRATLKPKTSERGLQ